MPWRSYGTSGSVDSSELVPQFARHETFHPRVGWLTKAVAAAERDPKIFAAEDAPIALGVGKNMVRAIRYWGLATKVIVETGTEPGGRVVQVRPTRIGRLLLGRDGWDRYAEDPRTLWLLHWRLLSPPVVAPVWWWAFEEYDNLEFEARDLERFIRDRLVSQGWQEPAPSSVGKDVDCLIRMYGRRNEPAAEGWLDSPFAALGLLDAVAGQPRRWRFTFGHKESLEPGIIAYACLDAMARWETSARTVSLARLAVAVGSPGRAFRISEADLATALRAVARSNPDVVVAAPAGLTQLVAKRHPADLAAAVLADLYGRVAEDVPTNLNAAVEDLPSAVA